MAEPDVLPHNLEAERAVLGACLIRQAAVGEVAGTLGADDFFRQAHADIWRAIRRLDDAGRTVDLVTIRGELDRVDVLDSAGGPAYVAALTDGVPRSTNVRAYAALVVESATKRRLAIAVNRGASIAEIAAIVSRLTDGAGLDADDDSPPWAMLDSADDARVEPWRGIGRGLVLFKGAVVSVTAAKAREVDRVLDGPGPADARTPGARHRRAVRTRPARVGRLRADDRRHRGQSSERRRHAPATVAGAHRSPPSRRRHRGRGHRLGGVDDDRVGPQRERGRRRPAHD